MYFDLRCSFADGDCRARTEGHEDPQYGNMEYDYDQCQFPFYHDGHEFVGCTRQGSFSGMLDSNHEMPLSRDLVIYSDEYFWCPTKLNAAGEMADSESWGVCNHLCPFDYSMENGGVAAKLTRVVKFVPFGMIAFWF